MDLSAAPIHEHTAAETGRSVRAAKATPEHFGNSSPFSFSDVLDILNPLQHIPFISTLYRNLTGDTIRPGPRIVGDALFGGPVGLVTGIFNAALRQTTGEGMGEHALAFLGLEDGARTPTTPEGTPAPAPPPPRLQGQRAIAAKGGPSVTAWAHAEIAYRNGLRAAQIAAAPSASRPPSPHNISI